MAAGNGSHVSVTHRYRHSCRGNFTNFCCKQTQQSTWLGRSERSASLFSCCRLSSFQQPHVLKSSLERKSKHCPYLKLRQSIKRQTMNFLTKFFFEGGAGWGGEGCFAYKYSLRHRKCGVRGYMHELFVSKTRTSEVRASEGFWHKQRVHITPYKALSMTWAVYYT